MTGVPDGPDLSRGPHPYGVRGGGDIQCEIMTIMHVIMVMLLCQAAMGRVPVLQCLLPGARGRLRLCAVMPVI
jgi:hypothetical protein